MIKSRFPVSTILPKGAMHFHVAWKRSLDGELSAKSILLLFVSRMISYAKEAFRELNIQIRGNLKDSMGYFNLLFVAKACVHLCSNYLGKLGSCKTNTATGAVNNKGLKRISIFPEVEYA